MTKNKKYTFNAVSIVLPALLVVAAVIRVLFIIQIERSDIGAVLPLDMMFYRELASGISSGAGISGGAISFNPLYPVFLAGVYRLFGEAMIWTRILQSVTGILTIVLIYAMGRRFALNMGDQRIDPRLTGLIAAFASALYPQFLLYEGSLLATTLVIFIFSASYLMALIVDRPLAEGSVPVIAGREVPLWICCLLLGLFIGAGALGRPNIFLLLVPAIPLWLYFRSGRGRRGLITGAVCLAGMIAMLLPPVIYNAAQTGKFVPVSTHGGINFYIGNRSGATGIYSPPEGMRSDMRGLIEDARVVAERETGTRMTDAETSDYWMAQARQSISSDPVGWMRLLGRKLLLFWNGTEVSDIVELSIFKRECPILHSAIVPFSLISAFALPGLILVFLLKKGRWLTGIFAGAAIASILLFYTNARYRIPSVPVLIVLGAVFSVWTLGTLRSREWKRGVVAILFVAFVFFFVSNRNMVFVDKSAAYTFLGNHFMQTGEIEKGEKAFAEAYRLAPRLVMTNINYGRALLKKGELEESRLLYDRAYRIQPDFPMLAIEYGSLLDQMGMKDEAVALYMSALEMGRSRDTLLACQLLSRSAYDAGRTEEAASWVRRALKIVPGDKRLKGLLLMLEQGEQ
ncbi:MAG: tetratricopeptide repeat protein [Candidatus Krumholzibacteria bacterium]|nr:tetratricopeptide repeat protein [Candidatus Krumholzibacteria bacterium]